MNENLRQCNIVGGVFYKSDLIKCKRGYESFIGQWLNIEARLSNMEDDKRRNFWLMVFPYILLGIGIILYTISYFLMSSQGKEYLMGTLGLVGLLFTNAAGVFFLISAFFFMKENGLVSYVGDPEAIYRETKGSVDFGSGRIYARTKDYEVYSGNQWVKIIGNIIKFFVNLLLMTLFGWLVYIIFRLRLKQVKKKSEEYDGIHQQHTENQVTSMLICTSDSDLIEGCTLYFQDGKYLNDKVNYVGTFYYKNVIYGAFETENDDFPVVVQILEGFNHFIIEDNEKVSMLIDVYNSLVES